MTTRRPDVTPTTTRYLAEEMLTRIPAPAPPVLAARRAALFAEPAAIRAVAEQLLPTLPRDPDFVIAWRRDVLLAAAGHRPEPPMPPLVLAWSSGDLPAAPPSRKGLRRVTSRAGVTTWVAS
jgi:hypothetical protein